MYKETKRQKNIETISYIERYRLLNMRLYIIDCKARFRYYNQGPRAFCIKLKQKAHFL